MSNLTPLWLLKFLPNMLACHVTIVHDAQAPSNTITCGEASSHLAIGEAFRTIARGDADVCMCGGAESKANPMAVARPLLNGRLNTSDNDRPERASRPFGRDRAGMVPSEGGGLVILEALEHAQARKARIYAELVGFGAGSNAGPWASPTPAGGGVQRAIVKALADAGVTAEDVDLVGPMGMGTPEHDAAEIAGWNAALGPQLEQAVAVTTRGALGNNGAGTGAIDFAAAVMTLSRNTVPPSLNTSALDSQCRFRFAHDDPKDAKAKVGISVGSAATGGQAAALVIRRFEG
jgi:3-oxoacyl-[acyl-carrier-protein] synthase II